MILNNASDCRANWLISDYIGWTNGLTDYGEGYGSGSDMARWSDSPMHYKV